MILEISSKNGLIFSKTSEGPFICSANRSLYYWLSFLGNSFVTSINIGIGFRKIDKAIGLALNQPTYTGLPVLIRSSNDLVGWELGSIFSEVGVSDEDRINLATTCIDIFLERYANIATLKEAIEVVILEQIHHPSAKIIYPAALLLSGMNAEFTTFSEIFSKIETGSAKTSYEEFLKRLRDYYDKEN